MLKTLYDNFNRWYFSPLLKDFHLIKIRGFGHFLVERGRLGSQRMGIYIPWYDIIIWKFKQLKARIF